MDLPCSALHGQSGKLRVNPKPAKCIPEALLRRHVRLFVTINSDDPAYFGGYMNENFLAAQKGLNLSQKDIVEVAKNGFTSSFLPQEDINVHLKSIDEFVAEQIISD